LSVPRAEGLAAALADPARAAGGARAADGPPGGAGGPAVDEARIRELLRRDFDGLVETRRVDGGH
jgi:hypothetical protein